MQIPTKKGKNHEFGQANFTLEHIWRYFWYLYWGPET
jgi:hypothetical protein